MASTLETDKLFLQEVYVPKLTSETCEPNAKEVETYVARESGVLSTLCKSEIFHQKSIKDQVLRKQRTPGTLIRAIFMTLSSSRICKKSVRPIYYWNSN